MKELIDTWNLDFFPGLDIEDAPVAFLVSRDDCVILKKDLGKVQPTSEMLMDLQFSVPAEVERKLRSLSWQRIADIGNNIVVDDASSYRIRRSEEIDVELALDHLVDFEELPPTLHKELVELLAIFDNLISEGRKY